MGMNRTIDITSEQRKTLLALLAKHLPDTTAWVYGSRVQWTARPQSDLDMVVFASPSQNGKVSALREALEESNLPFRIDLFVWDNVPDQFRKHIEAEHAELVEVEELDTENRWRDVVLSDIIDLIGGGTPKRSIPEYWNGPIPWLSVKDFNHDLRHVSESEQSITEFGLAKSSTTLLPKGHLIISARGTVGAISQLAQPMAFNQSCYGISAKSEYVTNDFLYYLIRYSIDTFTRMTHGAVFDTITQETFRHVNVELPTIPEQRAIAHILGTLDDKIELNRRMNETLEAMARALFKSWFVDFDPVHAKATLKRHDAHLSLRQEDFAKSQSNAPSHTRITPPLRGSRQDKGASPPSSRWGVIKRQYSQQTLQNARALRKNQTNAEGLLWHYLRNKQMDWSQVPAPTANRSLHRGLCLPVTGN